MYFSGKYEYLARILRPELDETQIEDVYQTLGRLPVVRTELALRFADGRTEQIPIGSANSDMRSIKWHRVAIDEEYTLCVDMKRLNKLGRDGKAFAPKYGLKRIERLIKTKGF